MAFTDRLPEFDAIRVEIQRREVDSLREEPDPRGHIKPPSHGIPQRVNHQLRPALQDGKLPPEQRISSDHLRRISLLKESQIREDEIGLESGEEKPVEEGHFVDRDSGFVAAVRVVQSAADVEAEGQRWARVWFDAGGLFWKCLHWGVKSIFTG